MPFTVHSTARIAKAGPVAVTLDASGSSQFVSALLMVAARCPGGLDLRHVGPPLPSRPHIEMTVAMLRERHVRIDDSEPDRWAVAPGPIAPREETVEPDLSNAAVFLAAAAITGGAVTVPHWPGSTEQPGDAIHDILTRFGAEASLRRGPDRTRYRPPARDRPGPVRGQRIDAGGRRGRRAGRRHHTSARHRPHPRARPTGWLRWPLSLERLGGHVNETNDGLTIHPRLLGGAEWRTYADHWMAQAGACSAW